MSDENLPLSASTERFVAYLDGELPESVTRELEQSLNSDSAARMELEKLNRAWELLDLLPRPNMPEQFTSRTMTAIQSVVKVPGEAPTRRPWINSRAAFVLGLLLIGVIGFGAGRRSVRPAPDPLLEDLPVIEKLDTLLDVGDVQFLRELQSKGGLNDRPSHEPP